LRVHTIIDNAGLPGSDPDRLCVPLSIWMLKISARYLSADTALNPDRSLNRTPHRHGID
jgi:hypothetical protein